MVVKNQARVLAEVADIDRPVALGANTFGSERLSSEEAAGCSARHHTQAEPADDG